jgi:hypothetical protein
MVDVRVPGGDEFARVARRLKQVDSPTLQREYQRGIRKAVAPLQDAVRSDLPSYMPSGYTPELAADLRLRSSVTGTNGVRITGRAAGREIRKLERGQLRHPVWGYVRFSRAVNRHITNPWVSQRIPAHFFTEPIRRGAGLIREALVEVLEDVLRKIAKG